MFRAIVLLFPLFVACQQAHAGTTSNPPTTTQQSPSSSQAQPVVTDEKSGGGITDPEGPRPGESIEAEQAAVGAAFDTQSFDGAWRTTQEGKFRAAFSELGHESSLKSVECRQTLCKLVVERIRNDRTRVVFRVMSKAMAEDDGFIGNLSFVQYPSADRSTTTVYVSRNHYSLPDKNGIVTARPKVTPTP